MYSRYRLGNCYLHCYRNTLLGDAYRNLSAITAEALVRPWEAGFSADACPLVVPRPCHGPQCRSSSASSASSVVRVVRRLGRGERRCHRRRLPPLLPPPLLLCRMYLEYSLHAMVLRVTFSGAVASG